MAQSVNDRLLKSKVLQCDDDGPMTDNDGSVMDGMVQDDGGSPDAMLSDGMVADAGGDGGQGFVLGAQTVYVSSAAGISSFNAALDTSGNSFTSGGNQGIALDWLGTAFHVAAGGELHVLSRLQDRPSGAAPSDTLDRTMEVGVDVVTDVGAANAEQGANFASDGKIYVIDNASTAEGTVTPSRMVSGPNTGLGNPVDIALDGATAYVAEKAGGMVLRYNNILEGESGNIAPDATATLAGAEAIALQDPEMMLPEDLGNITDPNDVVAVTYSRNAADGDNALQRTTDLAAAFGDTTFDAGGAIESIAYDQNGTGYITATLGGVVPNTGSVIVVDRLMQGRDETDELRDRTFEGAAAGLERPKGADVAGSLGLLFVADIGSSVIADSGFVKTYSLTGDGTAIDTLDFDTLGANPWDVDYHAPSDTLFVALTNGEVAVFDDWSAARTTVDRRLTPSNDALEKISTNIHGIVYVEASDQLIISDVGSGAVGTDGRIYVIDDASSVDGMVVPSVMIDDDNADEAGNTLLGNPVDITFDGVSLFVAEKSQAKVLRFDGILDLSFQDGDVAPNASTDVSAVESVSLIPVYLVPTL